MTTIPKWGGRRAQRARRWVIARDHGRCWICGHPGANSLDHAKSRVLHPELTWEPTNWRAAHMQRAGTPHGCTTPQCQCIGNRLRSAGPANPPTNEPNNNDPDPTTTTSRDW